MSPEHFRLIPENANSGRPPHARKSNPLIMKTKPSFSRWLLSFSLIAAPAWAATITVAPTGGDYTTIQAAINAAAPGDTISIATGTYALSGVVAVNKAGLTIVGPPTHDAVITGNISTGSEFFNVSTAGVTIKDLTIQKTDKAGVQHLIYVGANNLTIQNCDLSGQYVLGDGDVSRAIVSTYGISGLNIVGNNIHGLRQPGYLNGSLASPTTGTITSNTVSGTRGWVIDGANMTFAGNSWGTGANANYLDIAILATTPATYYADLPALSAANQLAAIEDQRSSPSLLTTVYVSASAVAGGNGTPTSPFQTIANGVSRVMNGGVVKVNSGTYGDTISLTKSLTLLGANAGIHPEVGTHPTEAVGTRGAESILTGTVNPQANGITIDGFRIESGTRTRVVDTYANANNFVLRNNIFINNSAYAPQGVIQFGGGSHTDFVLEFNRFEGGETALLYAGGGPWDRMQIRYNRINWAGDAVFWAATPLVDGEIVGNEIDGTIDGIPGYGYNTVNIGQAGNVSVRDNWVHDVNYTAFQLGVVGGEVVGNTFENTYAYSDNPAVYGGYDLYFWGGAWGTALSNNVEISCNTFLYNNDAAGPVRAIRLAPPANVGDPAIDASTFDIHDNKFISGGAYTGTVAIRHQGDQSKTLDAAPNYWGSASPDFSTMFEGPVSCLPYYLDAAMTQLFYPVRNVTQNTGFLTIQPAINGAASGDLIEVSSGTYTEDVIVNKSVTLQGEGPGSTTIIGPIGGSGSTVQISASNAVVDGFTITRAGNNLTDWNDPGLNTAAVAMQGQSFTGVRVSNNVITACRTGIDVNNSNGHTIRNNVITNNRTGLIFRNQTDNHLVAENEITNNWTVGVLFLDASSGTNSPVQTAANCSFTNNNISGNWYGQIVDRQTGGSLPLPGSNPKNFEKNWLGTTSPTITTANSAEPGYAAQIPVAFGGTATAPGGEPTVLGAASANVDINPFLASGTDTNVETTLGRGNFGFQGDLGNTIEGLFNSMTISSPHTYTDLYIAPGTRVTVTPSGSLAVDDLDLGTGATLEVNGGELDLGDGSVISGTFSIFNSFGSWDINGDTTFNIGQSLALISDIHVAAGKTVTVNGGGELILDGCVIDSQTPGSPYNFTAAGDGLLTMARCVVEDANIDINTTLAGNLRSRIYDNGFITSDIEAGATSKVYHNLLDAATAANANTDATTAFDPVDGWGNVTSASSLQNKFTLDFSAPVDTTRTLDANGNLFVQTADPVVMRMDVSSLGSNAITAAEALLGYNSIMLTPTGAPTKVTPEIGWEVIVETAPAPSGLGIVDSALGLKLGVGPEGITADSTIANVNFTAGTAGKTLGFFRVQTNRQFAPDGSLIKDTRLTKSIAGVPSLLDAFTANTGELIIDNEAPTIAEASVNGTQVQPTSGTVDVLDPSPTPPTTYVIRNGTPVVLTFTATDAGLAGLDAADAIDDLDLSATNGTTVLGDWTVSATESTGVVTYTVTLDVPADATTGTYAVTATVIDRSGNLSPVASLGSFQIANEVLATVELQGFDGGSRDVVFTATNGAGTVLTTWTKSVAFSGAIGAVPLEAVPAGTTAISAKTSWNLRSKKTAIFSSEGVAAVSLTGADLLPAGDLTGDNVVNTLDYSVLRYHWLTDHAVADLTGDAMVNPADYGLLRDNFYTVGDPQ